MKEKLESKLSKAALKELKNMLERNLESKLYEMIRPGFLSDNNYDEIKIYQKRIEIMKSLVEISSLYKRILRLLKDEKYNC